MIDGDGFRLNVGIVLCNAQGQVLWAQRKGNVNAWQFPQGGMHTRESEQQAMYRELEEELGLQSHDVELLTMSKDWLSYRLPEQYIRRDSHPICIGQKQKWFLLRLLSDDQQINLKTSAKPEFSVWQWVDYWYPIKHVIYFKRQVYQRILQDFADFI